MQDDKSVPVRSEKYVGCESCVEICREKAISVVNLEQDLSGIARAVLCDIF